MIRRPRARILYTERRRTNGRTRKIYIPATICIPSAKLLYETPSIQPFHFFFFFHFSLLFENASMLPTNNCNNLTSYSSSISGSSGISAVQVFVFSCTKSVAEKEELSGKSALLSHHEYVFCFPKQLTPPKRNETVADAQSHESCSNDKPPEPSTTVKCITLLIPCVTVEETNNDNNSTQ